MIDERRSLQKLLQGAGFSMAALLLGIALALTLTPYMVRTLGERFYGIFVLAASFTTWYGLLDFGLNAAVGRFITLHYARNDREKINEIASTAFFLYCGLGFLGFLASVAVAAGVFFFYPGVADADLLSVVLIFSGVAFLLTMPLQTLYGVLTGTLRHELSGSRSLLFQLLGAAMTFGVLYGGGRLIALSVGNLCVVAVNIAVTYRLVRVAFPEIRIRFALFCRERAAEMFRYGFFAFLNSVADRLIQNLDGVVIAAFVSINAVTAYNLVCSTLVLFFQSFMIAATGWLGSWFTFLNYRDERDRMIKTIFFSCKVNTYLASFIAFGLIVWGPAFIKRWLGAEYLSAYPCLVIMTVFYWVGQCQSVIVRYLYAVAKHRYFAYIQIGEGAVNLALSLILVHWYGVFGVALGTVIPGMIGKGIVLPLVSCRVLGVSRTRYMTAFLTNVAKSAAALLIPLVISVHFAAPDYLSLVFVGTASALAFFPAVTFFGMTAEERRNLSSLVFSSLKWK